LNFEIKEYEATLYEESKKAFQKIIKEQTDNQIYSLGFYTSGDSWGYLFPIVCTQKGIEEVASQYKKDDYYKDKSISYLINYLKWSPCDSPLHEEYLEELPKIEEMLVSVSEFMFQIYCDGQEEASASIEQSLIQATIRVLIRLQEDGVFSSLDRSTFTVNLINGDQSNEERLERAKMMNPKAVYEAYENDLRDI